MKEKKKKEEYVDDGHTIYNMDIDGFKWHDRKKKERIKLDKSERWHLTLAAFKAYLPSMIIIFVAFALTFGLLYLWLS